MNNILQMLLPPNKLFSKIHQKNKLLSIDMKQMNKNNLSYNSNSLLLARNEEIKRDNGKLLHDVINILDIMKARVHVKKHMHIQV